MKTDMNYCRRCGNSFSHQEKHVYTCEQGHVIYLNASPAVALLLFNNQNKVAVITRSIDPGLGKLDFPGGFCDGAETIENAVSREIEEEIGIDSSNYSGLEFVCSGIDMYELASEEVPVVAIIFKATLVTDAELRAFDDAATAKWMDLENINRDDLYFPSLKQALDKMIVEK